MNGKVVSEIENPKPESYTNVKVYAAGKYWSPTDAWIRNLQASTSNDSKATASPSVTAEIEVTLPTVTGVIDVVTFPDPVENLPIIADGGVIDYPHLFKLKKDNQIGLFDDWGPSFDIKFDIRINSYGSKSYGPGEILRFQSRSDDADAIPLIATSQSFLICNPFFQLVFLRSIY